MRDDSNVLAKAAGATESRRSRLSVASYVSAILTIVGLLLGAVISSAVYLFLFFVPAIVTGHLARRAFRKRPGFYRGEAMATFGIVIGYFGLAMSLLAITAILTGGDGTLAR